MDGEPVWGKVPSPIVEEVIRQQEKMGWPEMVPAYAEVPDAKGRMLFKKYEDLTVADCEQLVEHHSRGARAAIGRFLTTASPHSRRTSGRHILYARLYRCTYFSLTGKTDSTEHDMPFPCLPEPPDA